MEKLKAHCPRGTTVVFLAGARYREFLVPALREFGTSIEIPMEGLRIGEQLSWLANHSR